MYVSAFGELTVLYNTACGNGGHGVAGRAGMSCVPGGRTAPGAQ